MRITVQNSKDIKLLQLTCMVLAIGLLFGALIARDLSSMVKAQKEEIQRLNDILTKTEDLSKLDHPVITDALMNSLAQVESSNNPKAYNKSSGAVGKYQLRSIVYEKICGLSKEEAFDEVKNKHCAKLYLIHLYTKFNSVERSLMFFNNGYNMDNKHYADKVLVALTEQK